MLSVKRNWLNYIFTIAVIVLMTGIAEYCREPEIIFPEIAALAAGALSAPEQIWRVNRSRMFCFDFRRNRCEIFAFWILGTDGVCFLCGANDLSLLKDHVCSHDIGCRSAGTASDGYLDLSGIRCRTDSSDLYFAADQRQSGSAFERILSAIARCICRPGEKQLYTDPVHGCSQRGCASSRVCFLSAGNSVLRLRCWWLLQKCQKNP